MTAATYFKIPAFTPGTNESGMQPAASGDLLGRTSEGNEPAALPGAYAIGSAVAAGVYNKTQ